MKTITLKMVKKKNGGIGFHESQQLNSWIKIDQVLGFYLGTDRVLVFSWVQIGQSGHRSALGVTRSDPSKNRSRFYLDLYCLV